MSANDDGLKAVDDFESQTLPHMNDLYRAASSMLGSQLEAEDVAQEAYLQAWKSFHRFTPGTNCRAQHHRRKRFEFRFIDDGEEVLEQTLTYEPSISQDIRDEEVVAAFQKIPQQYREAVLLSDVYEFSYKEIQETLGIPAGTVMSRLSRGRQLLRSELAGFAVESGIRSAAHAG